MNSQALKALRKHLFRLLRPDYLPISSLSSPTAYQSFAVTRLDRADT